MPNTIQIDTPWKIEVKKLYVRSLKSLQLLLLDKYDDFANSNKEFYNPVIKKVLTTINGIPFCSRYTSQKHLPWVKEVFYKVHSKNSRSSKEHLNLIWDEFLVARFGLCVDTLPRIDNTLHDSGWIAEKSGILLQIVKAAESSDGDRTWCVFS